MKKNLLIFTIILPAIMILASCEKENIKSGDKKIVGTWILSSQTSTSISDYKYSNKYTPNFSYYLDNHSYSTSNNNYSFDGTKMTHIRKYNYEYVNGDYVDTYKEDTTYVYDYYYEITFNEDGTFTTNTTNTTTVNKYIEDFSGNWTWVNSSDEKMAVKLNYNTVLYIETMDNKSMTIKLENLRDVLNDTNNKYYEWDYTNNEEVVIDAKNTYINKYSETGEQIFTKKTK